MAQAHTGGPTHNQEDMARTIIAVMALASLCSSQGFAEAVAAGMAPVPFASFPPQASAAAAIVAPAGLPVSLVPALRPAAVAAPRRAPAGAAAALRSLAAGVHGKGKRRKSPMAGIYDGRSSQLEASEAAVAAEGDFGERFRVDLQPGGQVDLSEIDPAKTPGMKRKEGKAARRLKKDRKALDGLQQRLYAERSRSVLIVLQAMDTGGKDGVIRWVFSGLNPQGFKVTRFEKPTARERRSPFLKRIWEALPGKGLIGIFNRSQYEDILVPSVLETFPARDVEGRYDKINAFEKRLAKQGVVILKFFLHISKGEQKRRLQERLDRPEKNWKFSPADLETRARWDDYQEVYGKILARTSTPWAPWHVIPADKKWFRDYALARIVREAMERMDPRFPKVGFDPRKIKIPD
jgi:PPK2 family polyphosphate:nucleotide phosphotransferase